MNDETAETSITDTLQSRVGQPVRIFGDSKHASSLNLGDIERYRTLRSQEESFWRKNDTVSQATINKEISAFKSMLNMAVKYGKIESNPIAKAVLLRDNNVRERIISQQEFENLLSHAPAHLAPVITMAFYEPMRRDEIIGLTWDEIDLNAGFIRLYVTPDKR